MEIRLLAVYICLLAVCVSLLANIDVLYHKTGLKSSEILKNVHDSKFVSRSKTSGQVADMWFLKIWLIFCLLGGNFEFLRSLHHVGLFFRKKVAPVR